MKRIRTAMVRPGRGRLSSSTIEVDEVSICGVKPGIRGRGALGKVLVLLKRWLLGTHQGGVQAVHLRGYLEEFIFRFNRRTSRSRELLFYRLVQNMVQEKTG